MAITGSRCEIAQVGTARNGKPRWWCSKHGAPATGRYGVRLAECESAHLDTSTLDCLSLDPSLYPGGVGIWGAVPPVFDTTGLISASGVHVHARDFAGGDKVIDRNFDAVSMVARTDLFSERPVTITHEVAVAYYVSNFLGHTVKHLFCLRCGSLHLDAGYFATKPHKKHLCHSCGHFFSDSERGISNPISYFRALSDRFSQNRKIVPSTKVLSLDQREFEGGSQIWASNPALVWTSDREEEQGIHVHAYRNAPAILDMEDINDTFSELVIDGHLIEYPYVAQLMVQKALPHLAGKIVSISCPVCRTPHFDAGVCGVTPHKQHKCKSCGSEFMNNGKRKLVVSNPVFAILENLKKS